MVLINCDNCGQVFLGDKGLLCPVCAEKEEQDFKELKIFLKQNPGSTASQAAAGTGVAIDFVLRLLRQGRLRVKGLALVCARCGTPIESGVYCRGCQKDAVLKREKDSSRQQSISGGKDALRPVRKTTKGQIHSRRIRKKIKK